MSQMSVTVGADHVPGKQPAPPVKTVAESKQSATQTFEQTLFQNATKRPLLSRSHSAPALQSLSALDRGDLDRGDMDQATIKDIEAGDKRLKQHIEILTNLHGAAETRCKNLQAGKTDDHRALRKLRQQVTSLKGTNNDIKSQTNQLQLQLRDAYIGWQNSHSDALQKKDLLHQSSQSLIGLQSRLDTMYGHNAILQQETASALQRGAKGQADGDFYKQTSALYLHTVNTATARVTTMEIEKTALQDNVTRLMAENKSLKKKLEKKTGKLEKEKKARIESEAAHAEKEQISAFKIDQLTAKIVRKDAIVQTQIRTALRVAKMKRQETTYGVGAHGSSAVQPSDVSRGPSVNGDHAGDSKETAVMSQALRSALGGLSDVQKLQATTTLNGDRAVPRFASVCPGVIDHDHAKSSVASDSVIDVGTQNKPVETQSDASAAVNSLKKYMSRVLG